MEKQNKARIRVFNVWGMSYYQTPRGVFRLDEEQDRPKSWRSLFHPMNFVPWVGY